MKTMTILVASFCLFTTLAQANEQVIFDVNTNPHLDNFSLFFETPESVTLRPGIQLTSRGIEGKPGDGNFTAYKFADLATHTWTLKVTLQIPAGVRYSNSGIYLLYTDPAAKQEQMAGSNLLAFQEALEKGQARRDLYGAGPFELDYFSHEIQIIAGTDATIPPENHGVAAIYGVDIGNQIGQQIKVTEYSFQAGGTYEITVNSAKNVIKTYARPISENPLDFPQKPVLVSVFKNVSRSVDPIRGGSPRSLLLQGFYNNGRDIQLPTFKRITLKQ